MPDASAIEPNTSRSLGVITSDGGYVIWTQSRVRCIAFSQPANA